ncbi:MAG: glutamine-hydrolyzing carbamoyl-phosphate synthase small subunit [Gemmatimonadetes bacterium]|nr:glutamine-hydrolyzing carbamoyl-phosphate synthase small subunit [Gemmatimonadota bacterium]
MQATPRKAWISLRDGARFSGFVFGAETPVAGEVVFNTGMVGYPEAITDPSYYGQILVLTYPLVGNYGVPSNGRDANGIPQHFESERIQIRGLVTSTYNGEYHHWNADRSLSEWLAQQNVAGMHGVDTRALTRHLRAHGSVPGRIEIDGESAPDWYDPGSENVVAAVSRTEPVTYGAETGDVRIAVIDCGVKNNILRCLLKRGAAVTVVPWDYDLARVEYDGVLLSNGPGDPKQLGDLAGRVRGLLEAPKPVFGICLGCQIMGLAAGGSTFKLLFGHRGQNQPVSDLVTKRWAITSQNHGYAVEGESLDPGWEIWFKNGNDGTLEGLRAKDRPHRAVQFHPEAVCGPVDTAYLFDDFLAEVRARK